MSADNNDKKKRTNASNAVLYALFTVGAIAVINLLSTRVFGRLDLTENKVYTLSPSSRELVKTLPDYMSVKAFMSKDLPPELKSVSRYVRDLVDEYKTSSNGKFRWEAIDPGTDEKLKEEAKRCKVQPMQIQVLRSQKFELGEYYMGLCLEYNGQVESIPQLARPEGMEYAVSSLIKRMTQKKRKVAFTTGHGEADTTQGFQAMKQDLEQEFELTTVDPATAEIPADVDALVVGGPKKPLDDKARREIDKFLMKGKGAIFLADGMHLSAPGGGQPGMEQMGGLKMAQANDSGLNPLLEAYGFKVNGDFVFDPQSVAGPIDVNGRKMLVSAPYFVGAEIKTAEGLSIVDGIRGVVFPFASSVELVGPLANSKTPAKGKLWNLASSSKDAWRETGFFVLPKPSESVKPKEPRGVFNFGFAYMGPLKSAFAAGQAAESSPDKPPTESAKPVRLLVIGDSDFANDEYVQLSRYIQFYGAGAQMLFNAIGWIVEDEAMAPLRSKTLSPRPIAVSSEAKAAALQWANILGLPLAFCLFGIIRWRVRRTTRLAQKL